MRNLQRDLDRGMPTPGTTPTLATFMDEWLASVKKKHSPNTHKTYEMLVRVHIEPEIGKVRLHKLTQHDVNAVLDRKAKETEKDDATFTMATVSQIRKVLVTVLNEAMRNDYVGRNVASLSRTVKSEKFEGRALTAKEVVKLLKHTDESRYAQLYRLTIATGLRQGEILGLRWQDVDFDHGVLTLRKQLQRVDGLLQLVDLKTVKSKRTIPVPASLLSALKSHQAKQKAERLKAGGSWQGKHWQLVFMQEDGTPLDAPRLRKDFYKHVDLSGIGKLRFHDLRHSAATFMAANGMRPEEAMKILGHSDIETTLQIYTHTDLEQIRAGLERMGAAFVTVS